MRPTNSASLLKLACMLMAAVLHIEEWLHVFENCEAIGHPLPIVYPDPRDIEIKEDGTVHINGPTDRLAHRQMKELIEKRDGMLSALAVYDRLNSSGDLARERRFAKFRREARRINKALPLRVQVYVDAGEDASEKFERSGNA